MSLLRDSMVFACGLTSVVVLGFVQGAAAPKPPSAAMAKYDAVKMVWELAEANARLGRDDFEGDAPHEAYVRWSLRLADAAVSAQVMSPADAYGQHLARMEKFVATTEMNGALGRASSHDLAVAKYFAADAKLSLEQVRN